MGFRITRCVCEGGGVARVEVSREVWVWGDGVVGALGMSMRESLDWVN